MSDNPSNLSALQVKTMSDGGGTNPPQILQPDEQIAFVADPTDLATSEAAIISIRDGLIAVGLMKAS